MFRIRQTVKGFVVERKKTFLFFSYWRVYISYPAIEKPFYYETYNDALEDLLSEIKYDVNRNSPRF